MPGARRVGDRRPWAFNVIRSTLVPFEPQLGQNSLALSASTLQLSSEQHELIYFTTVALYVGIFSETVCAIFSGVSFAGSYVTTPFFSS